MLVHYRRYDIIWIMQILMIICNTYIKEHNARWLLQSKHNVQAVISGLIAGGLVESYESKNIAHCMLITWQNIKQVYMAQK